MPTLEWDIKDCLKRFNPKIQTNSQKPNTHIKQLKKEDITLEDIILTYNIIAKIVTIYGDKYLPIFERLHHEIEKRKIKNKMLKLARNITYNKLSTDNNLEN